jgi:hypothetical protein
MAVLTRKVAFLVEVSLLLACALGCRAAPAAAQDQTARVAPEPHAEQVTGDVDQSTATEMEESMRESGVEAGGDVGGDVSTVRYGLDAEMSGLLKQYGQQTVGVLAKVIGSAIVAVAGLLLWALNTNAPSSERLKLAGQVVGLAAMSFGPALVWTAL